MAESWDNVGLLLGRREQTVSSVVVADDLTRESLDLARTTGSQLIVVHHPPIFRPVKSIVSGARSALPTVLLEAIERKIAVFACHTNFDKGATDVVQEISEALGVKIGGRFVDSDERLIKSVVWTDPSGFAAGVGYGFFGRFSERTGLSLGRVRSRLGKVFRVSGMIQTGDIKAKVKSIGFLPGKASSFANAVERSLVDVLVCGEMGYHPALDLVRKGQVVLEIGHRQSERFFLSGMAEKLRKLGVKVVVDKTDVQALERVQ